MGARSLFKGNTRHAGPVRSMGVREGRGRKGYSTRGWLTATLALGGVTRGGEKRTTCCFFEFVQQPIEVTMFNT